QAVAELPSLKRCVDVTRLPSPRLPVDPKVGELEASLAQAMAEQQAGRGEQALRLGAEVTRRSSALGYRPLETEALLWFGNLQMKSGDDKAAEATLRDGLIAAEAAGDSRSIALAYSLLMVTVGHAQGRTDEGLQLDRLAQAALEHAGGDDEIDAQRLQSLARLFQDRGDHV